LNPARAAPQLTNGYNLVTDAVSTPSRLEHDWLRDRAGVIRRLVAGGLCAARFGFVQLAANGRVPLGERSPALRRVVDLLLVFALLSAVAGFRFFPHYFLPAGWALCVGAAPAVAAWLECPLPRAGRSVLAATAVVVLGFQIANAVLYVGPWRAYRESDLVYWATAARLARDPCFPGSRLFVWGWAPTFYYPRLDLYVRERHEWVDSVDGVRVFRRRGCRPTP
jgi:hypothetical protein